jgi:hypothetical protein
MTKPKSFLEHYEAMTPDQQRKFIWRIRLPLQRLLRDMRLWMDDKE